MAAPSPPPPSPPHPSVRSLSFNPDCGFLAVGTDRDFRIFNCHPLQQIRCHLLPQPLPLAVSRSDSYAMSSDEDSLISGGIRIAEMLGRSNILALVGDGTLAAYPPHKLLFWDEDQECIARELFFDSDVRSVRISEHLAVVALDTSIVIHRSRDLQRICEIPTAPNPNGVCALSHTFSHPIVVCPGEKVGQILVHHHLQGHTSSVDRFPAHKSRIACIAIPQNGCMIATASVKGTFIRIFSVNGTRIQEARRGLSKSNVNSMVFSSNGKRFALASDKSTVHLFNVNVLPGLSAYDPVRPFNPASASSSFLYRAISEFAPKIFTSERSFSNVQLAGSASYTLAFGHEKDTLLVVGSDARFYRLKYDDKVEGQVTLLEPVLFL